MDIPHTNKFIPKMIFIISLLAAQTRAHMIMANPVPYGYQTIDNSPLTSSNYPCKVTSDPATFYSQSGIDNTYAAGSVQTLSFKGSAVHGGGSCQLAITNDMQPSADTDWRVILSIESGCPSTDGTNVGTYNWTVPEDLAAGQYSFAWTWISKLAGQPEYYMNCAPITVTSSGSSSKRSSSSSSSDDLVSRAADYPELFVANLDSINSCKTSPGTDVVYPDPGLNVEKLLTGATPSFASISQAGCVPSGQSQGSSSLPTATAGGSGSSSGGSGSSADSSGAVTTSAAAAATTSSSSSTAAGAGPGGIFATGGTTTLTEGTSTATTLATITSTASAAESTSSDLSVYVSPVVQSSSSSEAATSSSAATAATTTTTSSSATGSATGGGDAGATSSSSSSSSAAETSSAGATSSPSSSSAATASSTLATSTLTSSSAAATPTGSGSSGGNSTSSGGSTSKKTGTCSDEGTFNCVGDQYQQCASGAWTEMRSLPSGTTCQQGESSTLWARGVGGVKSRTNVNLLRRVRRDGVAAAGGGGFAARLL